MTTTTSAVTMAELDQHWTTRAACKGTGELFFTEHRTDEARAIHLCRRHCPVFLDCESHTMRQPPLGIVQAGLRWHGPPKVGPQRSQPADPGCGHWCAGQTHRTWHPPTPGPRPVIRTTDRPGLNRSRRHDQAKVLAAIVAALNEQPASDDLTHLERGEVARYLHRSKGWPHAQVADALGVTVRSITRYMEQTQP